MKLTLFESSWLKILSVLSLIIAAIFMASPLLSGFRANSGPLADPTSLATLAAGNLLPTPKEETTAEFHGRQVFAPPLSNFAQLSRVLGTTSSEEKRIEVDLTHQKVYAYEGSRLVHEFMVSTGKWWQTPTGEFRIWSKVRSQKMEGGNKQFGTYYYLPNVPYVMFFYNDKVAKATGFSLHGTYWHDNFGHPMSHGCVNMRTEDAHVLYDWTNPPVTNPKAWSTLASAQNQGTKVIIYGTTPRE